MLGGDTLLPNMPADWGSADQFVLILSGLLCSPMTECGLMTVLFCHWRLGSCGVNGVGGAKLPLPCIVALDDENALANFGDAAASAKFDTIGERWAEPG